METPTVQRPAITRVIPEAHQEAAHRYIAVIVGRDPIAALSQTLLERRRDELWDQFVTMYADLSTGGYARHGADALRIALSRL